VAATARALRKQPCGNWDWVVVSLGANDVVAGRSLAQWRTDLTALQMQLDGDCGHPRLLFSGLPPMHLFPALPQPLRWYLGARAREFDRELQRWTNGQAHCERLATDFTTDAALIATDGFHPGPGLYRLWGEAVARHISDAVSRPHPGLTEGAVPR
jgi:lysophospholipase L1-like esterase